jgi:hypothetical protein
MRSGPTETPVLPTARPDEIGPDGPDEIRPLHGRTGMK